MTKKHFEHAAAMVRAILENHWTHEAPSWAITSEAGEADSEYGVYDVGVYDTDTERNASYTRAVQTAEAFVKLFAEFNPRFDTARFLRACGFTVGNNAQF